MSYKAIAEIAAAATDHFVYIYKSSDDGSQESRLVSGTRSLSLSLSLSLDLVDRCDAA